MTQKLINHFESSKYNNSDLWNHSIRALGNRSEENINTLKTTISKCVKIEEEICKKSGEYFGENDGFEYDSDLVLIVKYLEIELKTNLSKELSGFTLAN